MGKKGAQSTDINDQKLIEQIDEYNLNQLLMNLFKRLIMKAENIKKENQDMNLYNLVEKIKKNYPNFYFDLQESNDNFGIFYTDMNKLKKEYSKESDFSENDGFILLGFFEEEIRNFLKTHPFLLSSTKILEKNEKNDLLENKIKEIMKYYKENNELISDIFKLFTKKNSEDKQKYVDYIYQQKAQINKAVDDIKNYTYNIMSSEKNYKAFEKLKENLLSEQKQKEEEIKYYKSILNKYTSQGDEMTHLISEFKKYSNMINCLKAQ